MIDKIVFYVNDVDIDALEKHLAKQEIIKEELAAVALDRERDIFKYGVTLKRAIVLKVSLEKKKGAKEKHWKLSGHGSLHKFVQGGNHDRFNASEAIKAIIELGEILGISLDRIIITCLEIGVNLQMPKEPMKYIDKVRSHGITTKRAFIHMRPLKDTPHLRGKLCQYTYYVIKFYDKTFEAEYYRKKWLKKYKAEGIPIPVIRENILRYEIELHPKKFPALGFQNIKASTFTAEKLLNHRFYSRFVKMLEDVFQKTELVDLSNIHHEKSLDEIKNYIFVTSDSYNLYLDYLKDILEKNDYNKAIRDDKALVKEFDFVKHTESVKELKAIFEKEINLVYDTRKYSK
ncbi:hypothetical protein [Dysgonomonas sp. 511]|uniref:hypothetical protein n=1 Tax=Dysgonomonas sp. 511 TaxID=2302930 RepID=UPI0013D7C00E|nr:hypothetical protein [Dysgonomonas sp. 511]NDV79809.1 hypothetical protein [Dysgonomonas sp. 511]